MSGSTRLTVKFEMNVIRAIWLFSVNELLHFQESFGSRFEFSNFTLFFNQEERYVHLHTSQNIHSRFTKVQPLSV